MKARQRIKGYKIAYPYNKRKRPHWLGPVNFLPLCVVCKKPVPRKWKMSPVCSYDCKEIGLEKKDENR